MDEELLQDLQNQIEALKSRLNTLEGNTTIDLRIKTTTGDYASGVSGNFVINTFDNTYKAYADGGWRTLVSW